MTAQALTVFNGYDALCFFVQKKTKTNTRFKSLVIGQKFIFGGKFGNPSFCHINGMERPIFFFEKKAGISFT